jgi:hypothetical protein
MLAAGSGPGDPAKPVSRAEAAEILARFLELRGQARVTGSEQSLTWPAPKVLTPLSPEDVDPLLPAALRRLADRGIIDDTNYWLQHAMPDEKCDGGRAGELVLRAAHAFEPATTTHAQAVEVLARHQVIGRPDYWLKTAVPGDKCDGISVQRLIHNLARSRFK